MIFMMRILLGEWIQIWLGSCFWGFIFRICLLVIGFFDLCVRVLWSLRVIVCRLCFQIFCVLVCVVWRMGCWVFQFGWFFSCWVMSCFLLNCFLVGKVFFVVWVYWRFRICFIICFLWSFVFFLLRRSQFFVRIVSCFVYYQQVVGNGSDKFLMWFFLGWCFQMRMSQRNSDLYYVWWWYVFFGCCQGQSFCV